MIREVNNTFKNLLRAKGCQSIYKHMVGVGRYMMVLGLGFHPGPEPGLDTNASHNCPTGHSMGLREHWWP